MYNACLTLDAFPIRLKGQKLMLISKGKGDPTQASGYRPWFMLDSAGELLDTLLKFHLNVILENATGLSERQYGFRAGRSMIEAINAVFINVKAVQGESHFSIEIVLLATIDVRNAFKSFRWVDVLGALT